MADEREYAGDAPDAVAGGDAPDERAREGGEIGVPGESESEAMEDGTADPGAAGQDPERALVQAGSSSRRSRMWFSTAGSMSRTWRA